MGLILKLKIKDKNRVRPIDGHGNSCPKCEKGTLLTREVTKGKHKGKKILIL